jgi:hypothetical protein
METLTMRTTLFLLLLLPALSACSGFKDARHELNLGFRSQASADLLRKQMRPEDEAQVGEWMSRYYLSPEPDQIVARGIQGYIVASKQRRSPRPVTAFVSEVFCVNPHRLKEWADQARIAPQFRDGFAEALWLCGSPAALDALRLMANSVRPEERRWIDSLLMADPLSLRAMQIRATTLDDSTANLDAIWAAFFATGQEWPVLRVLRVASENSDASTPALDKQLQGVARRSLREHARQHSKVKTILDSALSSLPHSEAKRVESLLAAPAN